MTHRNVVFFWNRTIALALIFMFASLGSTMVSAAQEESEEMFSLGIVAVNCDIQAPTNITVQEEGCRPAEGVVFTVSMDMENGEGLGSCTAVVADVPNPITAGCSISIPYGASVSVNQDPTTVPAGYEIVQNAQKFTAPESPESGEVGGVVFVNLLQVSDETVENDANSSSASAVVVDQLPRTGAGDIESVSRARLVITSTLLVMIAGTGAASYWLRTHLRQVASRCSA